MTNQKRNGKLESLGSICIPAIKGMKIGKQFNQWMIFHNWQKIVGKDLANNVQPVKLEFKRLCLTTSHPAWAEQLRYMQEQLITKINNYAGEYIVSELVFLQGGYRPRPTLEVKEELGEAKDKLKIFLKPEEVKGVEALCQGVDRNELRERLISLGKNIYISQRKKEAAGWHKCQGENCELLCPATVKYCYYCHGKNEEQRLKRLREFLIGIPWAKYSEVRAEVECSPLEVMEARQLLIQELIGKLATPSKDNFDVQLLVMLYRSIPPEKLTDEIIDNALRELKFDLY